LAKLFVSIIENEKKIEIRKEVIAEMNSFEPFFTYQNILKYENQSRGSGIISLNCFKKFMILNCLNDENLR
jgi:hypothetical protein